METLRQQIFNAIVAQLRLIKTINTYTLYGVTRNYQTNLGDQIHPWRSAQFNVTELPAAIPRDLDEIMVEASPRSERFLRQLHIQVVVAVDGDDAPERLRKIFGDLDAAFGVGSLAAWGGLVSNTRPRLSRSVLDQESQKISGGIYEVYLDYGTYAFNSYPV